MIPLNQPWFTTATTTASVNVTDCVAIGFTASTGNSSIAIGSGATAAITGNVIIGASAGAIELLRVGSSVRFHHEGKNYTGEIAVTVDGYYYIQADSPLSNWKDGIVAVPIWLVTEIDPLQRFTEAVDQG